MLNRSSSSWREPPETLQLSYACYVFIRRLHSSVRNLKQKGFSACSHQMGTTPCMLNHETKQNGFTRLNSCAVSAAPPPIFWNMMFEVRLSCNVNLSISNNLTMGSTGPGVCWFRRHRIRQLMRKEEDFRERVFDHGSQGDGGSILPTSLFFTLYLTPTRSRRLYKKEEKFKTFCFEPPTV